MLFTLATTSFGLIFLAVVVEELRHSLVISIKFLFLPTIGYLPTSKKAVAKSLSSAADQPTFF